MAGDNISDSANRNNTDIASGRNHQARTDDGAPPPAPTNNVVNDPNGPHPNQREDHHADNRKRKRDWSNPSHRGGRGAARGNDKKFKQGAPNKRMRNNAANDRRRKAADDEASGAKEPSFMSIQFTEEEIAAEQRQPKRKVAVLIGYAGTGYHGLQINHSAKTIEGDIFAAFVAAGAISKANASDPRKSSFVRCARTDKGVHAAGNMLSLKLIIEAPGIVKKINDALPPQIRVWGLQRTSNSFSCYQACDSRWYEYLMPSYCLLPPHPQSYLGKKVLEAVEKNGIQDEYAQRMQGVKDYWDEVEKNDILPILESLDPVIREKVERRMHLTMEDDEASGEVQEAATETATETAAEPKPTDPPQAPAGQPSVPEDANNTSMANDSSAAPEAVNAGEPGSQPKALHPVDAALKRIKAAYVAAKRRYRVTPDRLERLQEALSAYVGTRNFHNYTIRKDHSDPSAKRHIKSFVANPNPIQINDTEWISLKVHGQSFMMHQIRKMVGMAILLGRCGTSMDRIQESYSSLRFSIPKAPGLGLLLERPVFESYNKKAVDNLGREELDFGNYNDEIEEFKRKEIYSRIFETEEKENSFHTFFHQIDNFKSDYFLWLTADGVTMANSRLGPKGTPPVLDELESGDEEVEPGQGEG